MEDEARRPYRLGIALSGGGARGFAHAGALKAIEEAGLRDKVKVMVGGAPVTQAFADEVGADAYTPDAGAAAARAVELVRG